MPAAKVIEAASTPREPWQPLYWRDTGIALGGSLVLALLAMSLVELFNRTQPQPSVVVVGSQPAGRSYDGRFDVLPRQGVPAASLERAEPALLASQPRLPRELDRDEVTALLQASDESSRLVALLLLSGVTPDEAIAARVGDVNLARGIIRLGAPDATLGSATHLSELVTRMTASASDPLLWPGREPGDAGEHRCADPVRRARCGTRRSRERRCGFAAAHVRRVSRPPGDSLRRSHVARRRAAGGSPRRVHDVRTSRAAGRARADRDELSGECARTSRVEIGRRRDQRRKGSRAGA